MATTASRELRAATTSSSARAAASPSSGAPRPRAATRGGRIARGLSHLIWRVTSVLLASLVLFEQWGWEPLSRWVGRLAGWSVWARAEQRIATLPPHAALAVLVLPWSILLPAKLLTLWLLASGHVAVALAAIVACKLVGTAVVARLFALTRPALLQWPWFARCYAAWSDLKSRLIDEARATPVWAGLRRWRARLRVAYRDRAGSRKACAIARPSSRVSSRREG